jgi:ABC-type multidrug transport system fused ATPase/permease subunit
MLDILNDPTQVQNPAKQAETISSLCVYFMIIAAVSSVCSAIENYVPVYVAEHVLSKVRHEFMKALLRQDMEWFDVNRGGEATSRLAEGTMQMSEG